MRLIAPSDVGEVERTRAEEVLLGRTVLATGVTRDVPKDGMLMTGGPATAPLLPRRWVAVRYEGRAETQE